MRIRIIMEENMRNLRSISALLAATVAFTTPVFADEHLKVTDEPLTLDIHFHFRDRVVYDNNWPVEKRAAELTGVSLNNVASLASTSSQEAFNLLIASGDIPDIVGGDSLKDKFNLYGPQGAFLPLNDLIEEHAPNIKAFFDENPELLKAAQAADGNLYFIPYLPDGKFARAWFVRQDWLDKLGLEAPDNVDELYEVLTAFRNQDPNGNGKKDEIPYFARQWPELLRLLVLWDGRSTGTDAAHGFYVEDGEVKHPYTGENYKIGISNIAKWYKEGLIDPEVFTRGPRTREELLGNNVGGMTHDWFASTSGYNVSLADEVPGIDFRAFLPPKSVSGKRIEENRRTLLKPDGWAIGHTNENPIETIKYFDFWFTEEGRRLANFGLEGEQYDLVDGKPQFKDEVLNSDSPVNAQLWAIGAQIPRGFFMDYSYEEQWTNEIALEGIKLYESEDLLIPEFLGVSMTPEEQEVYDRYWSSILTYMLEKQQAWILGSGDVEAEWDSYNAQLERLGYDKVMEVMNTAYDRQYGE